MLSLCFITRCILSIFQKCLIFPSSASRIFSTIWIHLYDSPSFFHFTSFKNDSLIYSGNPEREHTVYQSPSFKLSARMFANPILCALSNILLYRNVGCLLTRFVMLPEALLTGIIYRLSRIPYAVLFQTLLLSSKLMPRKLLSSPYVHLRDDVRSWNSADDHIREVSERKNFIIGLGKNPFF